MKIIDEWAMVVPAFLFALIVGLWVRDTICPPLFDAVDAVIDSLSSIL